LTVHLNDEFDRIIGPGTCRKQGLTCLQILPTKWAIDAVQNEYDALFGSLDSDFHEALKKGRMVEIEHAGERLVDFMGYCGGKLSERRHASDVREVRPSLMHLFFNTSSLSDIHHRANEFEPIRLISDCGATTWTCLIEPSGISNRYS
jgi:hypothetical protein